MCGIRYPCAVHVNDGISSPLRPAVLLLATRDINEISLVSLPDQVAPHSSELLSPPWCAHRAGEPLQGCRTSPHWSEAQSKHQEDGTICGKQYLYKGTFLSNRLGSKPGRQAVDCSRCPTLELASSVENLGILIQPHVTKGAYF
jgi:hypothetical protein